jgi:hypothetical protein
MPICGIHIEYPLSCFEQYKAEVPFLKWRTTIDYDSGELCVEEGRNSRKRQDHKSRYSYVTAQFKSSHQHLELVVSKCIRTYPDGSKKELHILRLSGSIHVSQQGNNIEDFTFTDVSRYLHEVVQSKLKILLSKAKLCGLEVGVNLLVHVPLNAIFDNVLSYKGHSFIRETPASRGGRFPQPHQFYLKLYRKSEQVLRFEVHYSKMAALAKYGIKTVLDLTDPDKVYMLKEELLSKWKEVILYDYAIEYNSNLLDDDRRFIDQVRQINYWSELYKSNLSRQARLLKKRRLQTLSTRYGINLHECISEMIFEKWEYLYISIDEITNHPNITKMVDVFTSWQKPEINKRVDVFYS